MAGIYIHIPFCKKACNYCNFYFSTSLGNKDRYIDALLHEIELSKDYLQGEPIETLYFGGGTPSHLPVNDLLMIVKKLDSVFGFNNLEEFTLEANPDDLTSEKLKELKKLQQLGLNRFSIGIQSFFDEDLKYMNRAHNSEEALAAVKSVQDSGFEDITIDLIYGTPTMDDERWHRNLETAFSLSVQHISSYALTVEPQTNLERKIKKGVRLPVNEQHSAKQFDVLMTEMKRNGYEQYEISNFAKREKYARHNTSYWLGKKYLGLGPSAHSYNGVARRWNVANNINYIISLEKGVLNFEEELLTEHQRINERIMTGLRTMWGVNLREFARDKMDIIMTNLKAVDTNCYQLHADVLTLTHDGKFFADAIAAQLFLEEE
ncbi:MAG: radical SAM family heme chaperone HemW [Chitinophagales bacterium]|nr:radical SAM family heme chaperone HemW [Chitinophagales bacterium]